tara:strand:+ start:329 stop:505 length:177 start_codon:yes stop_codon:yes gene_type:complete
MSYKGGDDWINQTVEEQKKEKRKYLVLEWIKDIEDPMKWVKEHIDKLNLKIVNNSLDF